MEMQTNRYNRFVVFLVKLGVGEDAAEADACRMEHLIGEETYAAIRRFLEGK